MASGRIFHWTNYESTPNRKIQTSNRGSKNSDGKKNVTTVLRGSGREMGVKHPNLQAVLTLAEDTDYAGLSCGLYCSASLTENKSR